MIVAFFFHYQCDCLNYYAKIFFIKQLSKKFFLKLIHSFYLAKKIFEIFRNKFEDLISEFVFEKRFILDKLIKSMRFIAYFSTIQFSLMKSKEWQFINVLPSLNR